MGQVSCGTMPKCGADDSGVTISKEAYQHFHELMMKEQPQAAMMVVAEVPVNPPAPPEPAKEPVDADLVKQLIQVALEEERNRVHPKEVVVPAQPSSSTEEQNQVRTSEVVVPIQPSKP